MLGGQSSERGYEVPRKFPVRDDSLPHQISLHYDPENSSAVRVSCNCLYTVIPGKGRLVPPKVQREFMPGFPKDTTEALAIYNDPKNHRTPFTNMEAAQRVPTTEDAAGQQ